MSSFDLAIDTVFKHEGFYSNSRNDRGGPTQYGISLLFLKSIGDLDGDGFSDGDFDFDGDVDINDIQAITRTKAKALYKTHWWDKNKYRMIGSQQVATKVFDLAVNMGSTQAHKLLQRAVNDTAAKSRVIRTDGFLGARSFEAINWEVPEILLASFRKRAADFYLGLIEKNPKFEVYRNGWLARAKA